MKLWREVVPSLSFLKNVDWKVEIPAAFVGAVLAIPQGVTFAFLAGVPAQIGVYCAIYVTFLAAFLGNSIMMSGPNTATSILMGVLILPEVRAGTASAIECVLLLSMMAGWIQLLIWLARGAFVFNYIRPAAISGVTMGVGGLIMRSAVRELAPSPVWPLGVFTVIVGFFCLRFFRRYYLFLMIAIGVLAGLALKAVSPAVEIRYLGDLSLQVFHWNVPRLLSDGEVIWRMLPSAAAVAFVSLVHTLVIAKDLKFRLDAKLDLNKEVFAIGMANSLAPFLGGFAGSGSFNRTQANEEMKVKTPTAAMLTAALIVLLFRLAGRVFDELPLAVISGVLFIVGFKMIHFARIREFCRHRFQAAVFFAVLSTMLLWGILPAVGLAVLLSLFARWQGIEES